MIKNKRIGKVLIATHMIDDCPDAVSAVFSKVIPLRAEMMWHEGHIEYIGVSDLFDERDEGQAMPQYDIEITKDVEGKPFISKVTKV